MADLTSGLYALADQGPDGTWDWSAVPAFGDEKAVLETFTAPNDGKTVVTVIAPDEG